MPDVGDTATVAGWLTAIAVSVAAGWKALLRIKRDSRDDRAERTQHDGYEQIVDTLREEVARLAVAVEELQEERKKLQEENAVLRRRVLELEREVGMLRGAGK